MIDLISQVAETKIQNDPKKAELETRYSHEHARIAELKPTGKNKRDQETQSTIIAAAQKRLENYEHKKAKTGIEYRDLTVELTHAKYNASLLDLDAETMKYAANKKVDLSAAVNESREYKKRLKAFLTACAKKDANQLDKALGALQGHMKNTRPQYLTVGEVQKAMGHSTATQANYFKKFANLLGVVTATRSNAIPMEVHLDNEITQDFLSL